MDQHYPPDAYDRFLCLKVPFHLIFAMLFAIRHVFIVFLAYNPSPKMASSFAFLREFQTPIYVFADLPALLVLVAWLKRLPESGAIWRKVWHNGRLFLTLSLLLQFALVFVRQGHDIWQAYSYTDSQRFAIVNLGADLLVIYYLWRFAVIRDVFADFPTTQAGESADR